MRRKPSECYLSGCRTVCQHQRRGTRAGGGGGFVRLCGCNLQCSYCDTQWANQPDVSYQLQTIEEIVQAILETGVRNVTLTGGEPLLTPNVAGLIAAITAQPTLSLEIETNGSVPLQSFAAINLVRFLRWTISCRPVGWNIRCVWKICSCCNRRIL